MNRHIHTTAIRTRAARAATLGAAGTLLLASVLASLAAASASGPENAVPGHLIVRGAPIAPIAPIAPVVPAPRDRRSADDPAKALRAALAEASSGKRAAQKLDGAPRDEALAAVAAQYVRIADNDTFSPSGRAEAAFRSGDVLRGLKRLPDAEAQYRHALELGQDAEDGRDFAAREVLELAHIKRRANDVPAALALYADVGSRFADQRRSAAHAATWTGKLLLKSGEREKAAPVLLGFAAAWPEYPTEAVRNADLLAVDQVEAGDEAGARETLTRIRTAMEPLLAKGGQQAEAVQKALDGMRVTDMLAGY